MSKVMIVFLLSMVCIAGIVDAHSAGIESFAPQGLVKSPVQAVAVFKSQMVPLGPAPFIEPFDIDCPIKGEPRWIDTKTWVYDFEAPLPSGITCRFALKVGVKDLSGLVLTAMPFVFNTGGPSVVETYPFEGSEHIEEQQVFLLRLDGPAKREAVFRSAYCAVKGINERIGVRLLSDRELDEILKAIRHEGFTKGDYVLGLQCLRPMPNSAEVRLVWGKGVESPSGLATQKEQIFAFKTREVFRARFTCQRESPQSQCIPLLPLTIRFTAPISLRDAERAALKSSDGKSFKPFFEDYDREEGFVNRVVFKGPFAEVSEYLIELPKGIKDESGRPLINQRDFPMKVKTGLYPPLAKFSSRFGIIESKAAPAIPLTVRNIEDPVMGQLLSITDKAGDSQGAIKGRLHRVEGSDEMQIIQWLYRTAATDRGNSIFKTGRQTTQSLSIPRGSPKRETEVIGIPLNRPGFYVAEVQSRILGSSLLGKGRILYAATAALATNLSVHLKQGRDSSLIWVTNLDDASPSPDTALSVMDCKGSVIWRGKTDSNGIARISKPLPKYDRIPVCEIKQGEDAHYDYPQLTALSEMGRGLFVFARKSDDLGLVHTSWDKGIEPWRYNLRQGGAEDNIKAHTIMDRTLLRAGEHLHMRHLVRQLTVEGFGLLKRTDLPEALEIRHIGSDQQYELPLKWDSGNSATTEWKIPEGAKLGMYQTALIKKQSAKDGSLALNKVYPSGSFRVEEFKVPLMRASVKPVKEELISAAEAEIDISLQYLSGGPAKGTLVKIRSVHGPMTLTFRDYDEYEFARGAVKTGMHRRGMGFDDEELAVKRPDITTQTLTLDGHGSARAVIKNPQPERGAQRLTLELEFMDPNGEVQTASRVVSLYPSSVLLGIAPESWAASHKIVKAHIVAVDTKGYLKAGVPIKVEAFKKRYYSHRKRIIGGFYSYEHLSETRPIGKVCEGKTDNSGLMTCEFTPSETGNLILQASALDKDGNDSVTHSEVWVAGREEQWFDVSDSDRIDLIPEKKAYEVGDSAVFQVRMPFREATALITVEREGIIDSFVKPISSKEPLIRVPIKKAYAPNVFVSALLVRGRVSEVQPTAMVDLGRPAFRLGIAEIRVGWKAHQLKVDVKPERDRYRVREQARVRLKVSGPEGQGLDKTKTSVVLAVIDEGLLELMPNRSWDLLQSMMQERGYQVSTATAQLHVVGRRHFGMKAIPHGGGGGRQITRELFDTLLYWNDNIQLDERGEAEVSFNLNDSITSFRIAAIAYSDKGLFGSGYGVIRTWQDVMLFSGLPRMVREGDQYRAVFTIRNASERDMSLRIEASINDGSKGQREMPIREAKLSAGHSTQINWDVEAPSTTTNRQWLIKATALDAHQTDVMKINQRIYRLHQPRTIQREFFQLSRPVNLIVQRPLEAIAGIGGIDVSASRGIINSIDGVRAYMEQYPYTCLEQRVSQAVALMDKRLWGLIVNQMPSYMDSNGLLKYFPSMPNGSDILTSYVLSISNEAGLEMPGYLLQRMQEGLIAFVNGRVSGYSALQTSDINIRRLSALEALSRYGMVNASLGGSINPDTKVIPSSALIDWINIIRRVMDLPDRDRRYIQAVNSLTARFVYHGATAGLTSERSDRLWWLMVSPDLNMLRTIITFAGDKEWSEYMPRLMRGTLARQRRGQWDTTAANAWGTLAVMKFVSIYESEKVTGNTVVSMKGEVRKMQWSEKADPQPIGLKWDGDARGEVSLRQEGSGAPWVSINSIAAIPIKSPVYNGYTIKKTYQPLEQRQKGVISIGDLVKVTLEISANSDMTWVVVKDPLPGGAVVTATGLNRDVGSDEKRIYPAFEEKAADSYRAYFGYLPQGKWTVQYIMRLNTAGRFNLPETRIEALYDPDLYGEIPNERFIVKE